MKGKIQMKKNITRIVAIAVAVVFLLVLATDCFTTVPVGSTGILLTLGKVQEGKALSEGLHF